MRLRGLTEAKVVPYGKVLHNALLRHVFSILVLPARARHVIVVPIGLTGFNIMVKAIAATVARDLVSDFSLETLRN